MVKQLVQDLNIPSEISICETLRESDGLAMSSRNTYLTKEERPVANVLYRALSAGKRLIESSLSDMPVTKEAVIEEITKVLQSERKISKIEYISLASHLDMLEIREKSLIRQGQGVVLSSAVRLGSVRLIDNLLVGPALTEILTPPTRHNN